jgi:ABC-type lipoprotein release transport system permease subunit
MALPLTYNVRNVRIRWKVTLLAVIGIALVVAVFAVLLSMSEGFATALRSTGRPDNVIIVQRGSASELTSGVPLDQRQMILADDRIARSAEGQPLASWEWVVVIALPKKTDGQPTNVTMRAVIPQTFDVRGGIHIVQGRAFQAGLDEIIVGHRIMDRIQGLKLDGTLKYEQKTFKIVGVFESEGQAFESEIWGDFDVLGAEFHRGAGSNSVVARMKNPADIPALDKWIRAQPQMQLQALSERRYYEEQAGNLVGVLRFLAGAVALITGIGAVIGAMNTMNAIVAARTREIATLRALGFSRRAILFSFVLESVLLALVGGVIGCLLAVPMHGFSTGTGQTQSFSEIAFAFRITSKVIVSGLVFAVVMGALGGLLPALRAAKLPIARAFREV